MLFILVESFVEDQFVEDEEENESRHHLRKVSYGFII